MKAIAPEAFGRLLVELRPRLHRYCARMTGSVVEGEDVVQETLEHAWAALPHSGPILNPEAWLLRIAHNRAVSFVRARARRQATFIEAEMDMAEDPASGPDARLATAASLRTLMELPVSQRACVVLMDVLGYSLNEIGGITGATTAGIKADLHRGRQHLRDLAQRPDPVAAPSLGEPERARLALYVDRFNARDFAAVRDMLADDVELELVNAERRKGRRQVGTYFENYAGKPEWILHLGFVDGLPAILVTDTGKPSAAPRNFILLTWLDQRVARIRDFAHASYAVADAEIVVAEPLHFGAETSSGGRTRMPSSGGTHPRDIAP
jgi:RNA polymerase sigma-70 factor (ECF subfamily)